MKGYIAGILLVALIGTCLCLPVTEIAETGETAERYGAKGGIKYPGKGPYQDQQDSKGGDFQFPGKGPIYQDQQKGGQYDQQQGQYDQQQGQYDQQQGKYDQQQGQYDQQQGQGQYDDYSKYTKGNKGK